MGGKLHKGGQSRLRTGRYSQAGRIYHVTTSTFHRRPALQHFRVACTVARCLNDPILLGDATLLAWVLMPDHAHLLLQLGDSHLLNKLMNHLKSGSARCANRIHDQTGTFWARGFYDHAMRQEENVRETARYIINNPLRAGLVATLGEYPFWNTVWPWFPVSAKPGM